jgi:S1-C subfamily serine protease
MQWLGATLTELSGVEFSAYGVSQADGGVALSNVGPRTQAAKFGLQNEDLIQAVNGRKTANVKQFYRATAKAKGTIQLKVVRDQQVMELEVTL